MASASLHWLCMWICLETFVLISASPISVHTENLASVKSQLTKQAGRELNGGADSHRKHFTGFANLQPSIHHNRLKEPTNADVEVKRLQTAQEEVRKEQPLKKVEKDTNAEILKVQEEVRKEQPLKKGEKDTNAEVLKVQEKQKEVHKEQPLKKVEKDTNAEVLKVQEKPAEQPKYNRVGWLMPYDEHPNSSTPLMET